MRERCGMWLPHRAERQTRFGWGGVCATAPSGRHARKKAVLGRRFFAAKIQLYHFVTFAT